jgi:hypothetical protein
VDARLSPREHLGMTEATEVPDDFLSFAQAVLEERERMGIRGMPKEWNRYRVHIVTAPFAGKAVREITPTDIAEWLESMAEKAAKTGAASGVSQPVRFSAVSRSVPSSSRRLVRRPLG